VQRTDPLREAVSRFGVTLKPKFSGIGASGSPEDQLRGPVDQLVQDIVSALGWAANVVLIGESSVQELKTRPDFAVTKQNLLVGFIELKAPGKGADPRSFGDPHDKEQWQKLRFLPNLVYTDGNSFSLWQDSKLQGEIVQLEGGSVESAGASLRAPPGLLRLFEKFLSWNPIPPRSAPELAEISARLCRLLRDEVIEQMERGSAPLTSLAADWRRTLFPDASNETFADGYAQAVTFGLLMARAQGIVLSAGLDQVSRALRQANLLIGTALRVLTDDVDNQATLKTSLDTLIRVLDVVHWPTISKGRPEAWLYFYEGFLRVYDNALRKKTGSYYTPPEIVTAMVRLVDETLRDTRRFGVAEGLASQDVTLADPAMGTGTFLLGVLQRIADRIEEDQGSGAVPAMIRAALTRLIGFEIQFGPFAVAQLRLTAEVIDLLEANTAEPEHIDLRLFLTDTLGNPNEEHEYIPISCRPWPRHAAPRTR
jgi:N-6 DNA Methylase